MVVPVYDPVFDLFLPMRTSDLGFGPGRATKPMCGSTRFSCDRRQPASPGVNQDNILCASLLRTLVLTRVLARDLKSQLIYLTQPHVMCVSLHFSYFIAPLVVGVGSFIVRWCRVPVADLDISLLEILSSSSRGLGNIISIPILKVLIL